MTSLKLDRLPSVHLTRRTFNQGRFSRIGGLLLATLPAPYLKQKPFTASRRTLGFYCMYVYLVVLINRLWVEGVTHCRRLVDLYSKRPFHLPKSTPRRITLLYKINTVSSCADATSLHHIFVFPSRAYLRSFSPPHLEPLCEKRMSVRPLVLHLPQILRPRLREGRIVHHLNIIIHIF